MKQDTIVALASGSGRAGVAVIRLSGPQAGDALKALTGAPPPEPRRAERRAFRDAAGKALDDGLALWFPGPASFTGEDVVELHAHGGPAVILGLTEACLGLPGVRPAAPGEFTRRAFENGKLDLAEAEGLADLVDAETEGQRVQALRQMQGGLSAIYERWRAQLIEAMALLEAAIDFPDEDLPADLERKVGPLVDAISADLARHLDDAHRGERVRDGYRIAIIGAPNAGKSSLLNALARREAAIVSDIPGTTRDVVEVRLVLGGFPVWIADTAGLREAADAIEAEGVRRALARAEEADLRIGLVEPGQPADPSLSAALRAGDLLIQSKADLGPPASAPAENTSGRRLVAGEDAGGPEGLRVSAKTGLGMPELEDVLARRVTSALGSQEAPALTRVRHRRLVEEALAALRRSRPEQAELWAEDLRLAARALGRLTGRIDVEDLLDQVFSSFCIGK
ncbi:MAG TPA: tRNA uridine-5-carboxymethylaminomethyl(34) synthesis GTPase MnmE [Caulobacterales bacterium]|nr:tRNA uridine-5-carboxymethylaminomethyl(34) synthesis GTPase MnmE [Caulobacterales bacterium]